MRKPIAGLVGLSCFLLAVTICAAAGPVALASPEAPVELTPDQQQRIENLIVAYCRAGIKGIDTDKLVDSLLDLGEPGARQIRFRCEAIFSHRLDSYRDKFAQAVARLTDNVVRPPDQTEMPKLRAEVLALRDRPKLTHDMIVDEADPAMKRLRTMIVVLDRQTVLDKNPDLKTEREKLLALGRQRDRIQARFASDFAATLPAANGVAKKDPGKVVPAAKDAKTPVKGAAPRADARPPADQKPANQKPLGDQPLLGDQKPTELEQTLRGEEDFVIQLAAPMDSASRDIMAANARLSGQLDAQAARTIAACNLARVALGLPALAIDLKLCAAARDHCDDMHKLGFFAHQSPVAGKENFWDRARNFGTTASGENIASGAKNGDKASDIWFHSPGHFKNMLGNHKRIGVGHNHDLYTELFGQ